MLVGQWRLDLVGLERKLQNELDEGPQIPPENGGGKPSRRFAASKSAASSNAMV